MAGIHFYSTMIYENFNESMRLPDKFVNCCGKELSKDIDLKGPSGNMWRVELVKTTNGTFFQTGWKEFVKDHHIEETDLLFFTYVGNSCFDIVIFDKSSCVKVTSYYVMCRSSLRREESKEGDDPMENLKVRSQIRNQTSPSRSNGDGLQGQSSPIPHNFSRGKRNIGSSSEKRITRGNQNRLEKTRSKSQCEPESVERHNSKGFNLSNVFISTKRRLSDEEEERVVQLASAVQLNNPYFVTVMHTSMVRGSAFMTVPSGFKATYFPSQSCLISLEVPGFRKKWTVKFNSNKVANGFCGGWKGFADDHNLEVGDICLFELTSRRTKIVMTVHISRADDHDE